MNEERLELIIPTNEYKEQVMEYRKIFLENEESFDGCAGLEECNTYEEWLDFDARNKYCFDVLGLRRIENGYFPDNEKSRKMQLRLGYKDEGVRRKKFLCLATNEYVDECITGLLKEEFIEYG